jgi:CHASE1-domain containing sensor protein
MAASNDPAGLDRGSGLRATFAALAIVAAGLAVVAACAQWLVAEAASDSAERLDRLAARVGRTIEQRFATPVYGLRGLRASMAAHGDMSRSQFRDWVSARDLPAEFPGVRAFAYAEQVYRWSTIRFV